jgi:hypothetical protein
MELLAVIVLLIKYGRAVHKRLQQFQGAFSCYRSSVVKK